MLIPDVDLAKRIEASETRLLTAAETEIRSRRGPVYDGFCTPIAGGVATYVGAGAPLNKVAGLGFGGPVPEAEWVEIERAFAARGCPVQVELSNLADPAIGQMLTRRGFVLMNFENVLGIAPDQPAAVARPADSLTVEVCRPAQFQEWLDIVVTGFETPDDVGVASHESFSRADLERIFGEMAATPGFVHYLARRDGVPAGGGSMFIGEHVGHLCGASTLPQHRRRGVQTALLTHRLADAHRRGCALAVITTQPGSKSQQNAHRRGFQLLYTRAILVR